MNEISMLLECPDRCCEVTRDEVSLAELFVERLVSDVLLTFFNVVSMHSVDITFPPLEDHLDTPIRISIRARGHDPLPHVVLKHLDFAIEDHVARALVELFGSLNVEQLVVG